MSCTFGIEIIIKNSFYKRETYFWSIYQKSNSDIHKHAGRQLSEIYIHIYVWHVSPTTGSTIVISIHIFKI
jgi:hypothetical protein